MKTKGPVWKEKHRIQNIYVEDSKVNTIVDRRQEMKIWENYVTELYNQPNRSENVEVEPQEEVDTDKQGPYIFQVKWKLSRRWGIKHLQEMMMYRGCTQTVGRRESQSNNITNQQQIWNYREAEIFH